MTTPPAPGSQPDWSRYEGQPGTDQGKLNQFRADYADAAAGMPKTAAAALDQAHRLFISANAATKNAQRYTFRWRKRRKMLDLAGLSLGAAHWLMLEEQRLRLAEQPPASGTADRSTSAVVTHSQIEAYRALVLALQNWQIKLGELFKRTTTVDLSSHEGRDKDLRTRAAMAEGHDAIVTALSNVEMVGSASAVKVGREIHKTLYRSCGILFDRREPEMPVRERKNILESVDFAPLIAEIRDAVGVDMLGSEHGEPARFIG
jgi:hypothetical protein